MKKILALVLALVMVLSLAACGGKTAEPAPEAKEEAAALKQKEKEEAFAKKQKEKEEAAKQKKKEKAAEKLFNKTIGRATSSAFGSIGRHIGNSIIRGLFGNSK